MTPPRWSLGTGALVALVATAAGTAQAQPEPLLRGPFAMSGRVTVAVNVRGERRGDRVSRGWLFASGCPTAGPCALTVLGRQRAGGTDVIALRFIGAGRYSGNGRFAVPIVCAGRRLRRGGEVPFSIAVKVIGVGVEQGISFVTAIAASYISPRRINRTRCAGYLGHDAASYVGGLVGGLPPPPVASFATSPSSPLALAVDFGERSIVAVNGAPITSRQWDFGDPASGSADASSDPAPRHVFSAPGIYTVTLSVTDAYGLRGSVAQRVTVP